MTTRTGTARAVAMWLLDVPGAGVTVIWSWAFDHTNRALAGNQAYIDGLSFT
jgi:hypothetical protein